jgi:hypothetical protein
MVNHLDICLIIKSTVISDFSIADGKFQLTISSRLNITNSYTILSTESNSVIKVFKMKLNTSKTRSVLSGRISSVELSLSDNAEEKDR